MAENLELLDKEFKIIMMIMLMALREKVENRQQMSNASGEMDTLCENQKKILEIIKYNNRNEKCI